MRTVVPLTLLAALLPACPALIGSGSGTEGESGDGTTANTSDEPKKDLPDPTTGFQLECFPGEVRCSASDTQVLEVCAPTGLGWISFPCTENEKCIEDVEAGTASCIGPCEMITNPNSVGCEFIAIKMASDNADEQPDALVVGNTDPSRTAEIQLHFTPKNSLTEAPLGDPILLGPGESHVFLLTEESFNFYSNFRNGGVYRLKSDIPLTAYLHSTFVNDASNDASMLLPTPTLRKDYIIASYPGWVDALNPDNIGGRPSYFNVIALEDDTHVEWVAPWDTAAQGALVPHVPAGETGAITLNRFDVLQVGASSLADNNFVKHDLSGTIVRADKPIWVMGATRCAYVPHDVKFCNHLQELMIPLEYWGKKYIGPHSPARADEKHYWRVYAGKDNVFVTIESNNPKVAPPPQNLAKQGDFIELAVDHGTDLIFTANGPILPVQYLTGGTAAAPGGDQTKRVGDPAMYQMVPFEQWQKRYVFVTGANYALNYVHVIRRADAADVTINGEVVTGYRFLSGKGTPSDPNRWEIADVPLGPSPNPLDPNNPDDLTTYVVESADEFNIVVVGYTVGAMTSAYAFPGGMNLKPINPDLGR
ncbi:MAG TPA: IgGFc-binding protein [Nannocystis sp.]